MYRVLNYNILKTENCNISLAKASIIVLFITIIRIQSFTGSLFQYISVCRFNILHWRVNKRSAQPYGQYIPHIIGPVRLFFISIFWIQI